VVGIKMVELSDPKGPYQEGISNSIFIVPGIIIVILVGNSLFLDSGWIHLSSGSSSSSSQWRDGRRH